MAISEITAMGIACILANAPTEKAVKIVENLGPAAQLRKLLA